MAYVIMKSVREKEEQEGKTAEMVGAFVFLKREKSEDAVSYFSSFCLSLQRISKYLSFLPNQLLCVFFKYSLSRVCVCSPCSVL